MKFDKKIIGNLEKCYSIAPLKFQGKDCILVAAEKHASCLLFDQEGNYIDTIWDEPGGVMTMVQVPGKEGEFLATHRFYSPNDSKEASLVYVRYEKQGWKVRELMKLPFVHRFDILHTEEADYLIACTLKSGHEYKDDWRNPGKIYVCELPQSLENCEEKPLSMTVLKDGLFKNHGYTKCAERKIQTGIISCENGVFQVFPPEHKGMDWKVKKLLAVPASDTVKIDLDGDGRDELFVFSPFHGDTVWVYREEPEGWKRIYEHPEKMEMLHAIYAGNIDGKKCVYFGYRKQNRELMCFYYDQETGSYKAETIDKDCGPANVYFFEKDGMECLLAANREIDEIALYSHAK